VDRLEQFRHRALVARVGGANELVVGDVERLPRPLEHQRHLVRVGLGILAQRARLALDVGRMLVGSHQEIRVEAGQPLVAGKAIGPDLLVRGAQVRPRVDIVDGGGE
jgi:hypothetical protein